MNVRKITFTLYSLTILTLLFAIWQNRMAHAVSEQLDKIIPHAESESIEEQLLFENRYQKFIFPTFANGGSYNYGGPKLGIGQKQVAELAKSREKIFSQITEFSKLDYIQSENYLVESEKLYRAYANFIASMNDYSSFYKGKWEIEPFPILTQDEIYKEFMIGNQAENVKKIGFFALRENIALISMTTFKEISRQYGIG